MNQQQIAKFVHRYLTATGSTIIEKQPGFVTVKLSPEADRALTGRDYYWNFVERTGVEPETMTFTFVFDQAVLDELEQPAPKPAAPPTTDSILGRYFGFVPTPILTGASTKRAELLNYGSRRLKQIFHVVREQGRYVQMYEAQGKEQIGPYGSTAYTSWLCVNFKVDLMCDMKREELHSLGISLSTGEIVPDFHQKLASIELSPRLPANAHLRQTISLERAAQDLEQHLSQQIMTYDHGWALDAQERLEEELVRIDHYYMQLRDTTADEAEKEAIEEQYQQRKSEIKWQYSPRIRISAINCAILHLWRDTFLDYDASRVNHTKVHANSLRRS